MNSAELHELLAFLEHTPTEIHELTKNLGPEQLILKPAVEEFSMIEQVCHLRDIEREGYELRIRRLLTEDQPQLLDLDGAKLASERDYIHQDFAAALDDFSAARQANVEKVRTLSKDQLARGGDFAGTGAVTVEEILLMMREHDKVHRRELHNLREWLFRPTP